MRIPRGTRRSIAITACAVLLGTGLLGPAQGATEGDRPSVKMQTVKLKVDLAGFVEVKVLLDTTSDCYPGIRYVQTNKVDFETGKPATTKLVNVSMPGTTGVLTSKFSAPVGKVSVRGSLSDQNTTNTCKPPLEELPPFPTCDSTAGRVSVSLQQGGVDEGDLVGLNGKPLNIAIQRVGGNQVDMTCAGRGADSISGPGMSLAVIGSSMVPGVFLSLPTGLGSTQLFLLKKGTSLKRDVVFSGPCTGVEANVEESPSSPAPAAVVNADGDCFLTGKVVMTIRKA